MVKIDPNFTPPPGFQAIMHHTSAGAVPCTDRIRLHVPSTRFPNGLAFYIGDEVTKTPVLPLRGYGELWHMGWDIPTTWAIDGSGQCWVNDTHGFPMTAREATYLLAEAEEYEHRQKIRELLGLPKEKPEWQVTAEQAGWTPPS